MSTEEAAHSFHIGVVGGPLFLARTVSPRSSSSSRSAILRAARLFVWAQQNGYGADFLEIDPDRILGCNTPLGPTLMLAKGLGPSGLSVPWSGPVRGNAAACQTVVRGAVLCWSQRRRQEGSTHPWSCRRFLLATALTGNGFPEAGFAEGGFWFVEVWSSSFTRQGLRPGGLRVRVHLVGGHGREVSNRGWARAAALDFGAGLAAESFGLLSEAFGLPSDTHPCSRKGSHRENVPGRASELTAAKGLIKNKTGRK